MAQTLETGNIITAADFTAATESKKIAIKNGNNAWLSEKTEYEMQCLASSGTLTSNEVFLWEPAGDGQFYLKKLCAAPEEGYVYLTDNKTTQGANSATTSTLGIGSKDKALKFTAIHPTSSGLDQYYYSATDNDNLVRFYNSDNNNWINCENSGETASFRETRGKGAYTAHYIYDMSAYYLLKTTIQKDDVTTTEYTLHKEGDVITVPAYDGYTNNYTPTTKDATDTQEITVIYTEEAPEPIEYALYHPSGTNMTAAELMEVTEPTYIAIKGLADKNKEYWNYVSGETNTSTEYFKQNAIFVWEPVTDGESGSYYLRKVGNGYMQSSNPGTYAETTEGAAVFTAVKPVEVASGANGELQFNKDTKSTTLIANAGGADNIVRFVTCGKWLNIGDRLTSSQAPAFNNGYGTFTIYQICELEGFDESINITIKNTGDEDYATFYSNAPTQMPEGVTAYTITEAGIANGYISLNEIANNTTIPANTGVILKTTVEADEEIAITVVGDDIAPLTTNLLKGSVENKDITEEAYVLGNVDGIGLYKAKMTDGVWLNNAGKAYLPASAIPASAQASNGFRFGEGTTGIEDVKTENRNVKTIYDLTGRRVETISAPGIYIVGGRKVLVK